MSDTVRPRMAGDRREEAIRLLREGGTDAEVARRMGAVRKTIQFLRREVGIAPVDRATAARKGSEWKRSKRGPRYLRPSERNVLEVISGGPMTVDEVTAVRRGGGRRPTHQILVRLRKKGLAFCEGGPSPKPAYWQTIGWWLAHNSGMVWNVAQRIARKSRHLDVEDIASEVRVEVARCVRPFRPKGWKFSTYALSVAERSVRQWAVAEHARGVRLPFNLQMTRALDIGTTQLVDHLGREHLNVKRPSDDGFEPPLIAPDFWDRAVWGLDPRSAAVFLGHYRDGKTYVGLGEEFGVSRGRIEQIIRRAEEKVRKHGKLDEFVA